MKAGSIVFQILRSVGPLCTQIVPLPNLTEVVPCMHGITAVSFHMFYGTTTLYTTHVDAKGVLLFDGSSCGWQSEVLGKLTSLSISSSSAEIPAYLPTYLQHILSS